jgi:hypothetical protein
MSHHCVTWVTVVPRSTAETRAVGEAGDAEDAYQQLNSALLHLAAVLWRQLVKHPTASFSMDPSCQTPQWIDNCSKYVDLDAPAKTIAKAPTLRLPVALAVFLVIVYFLPPPALGLQRQSRPAGTAPLLAKTSCKSSLICPTIP